MKRSLVRRSCAGAALIVLLLAAATDFGTVRPGEVAVIRFLGSRAFRLCDAGVYSRLRVLESIAFVSLKPWSVQVGGSSREGLRLPCATGGWLELAPRIIVRIPPRGVYQAVLAFGEREWRDRAGELVRARARAMLRKAVGASEECSLTPQDGDGAIREIARRVEQALAAELHEKGVLVERLEVERVGSVAERSGADDAFKTSPGSPLR